MREKLVLYRLEVAQARLADDPDAALDVLTFALCGRLLAPGLDRPLDIAAIRTNPLSAEDKPDTPAGESLRRARADLDLAWAEGPAAEAWPAFRALSRDAGETAAFASPRPAGRGPTDGVFGRLVRDLGVVLERDPADAGHLSGVPKQTLLAIAASVLGGQWAAAHARDEGRSRRHDGRDLHRRAGDGPPGGSIAAALAWLPDGGPRRRDGRAAGLAAATDQPRPARVGDSWPKKKKGLAGASFIIVKETRHRANPYKDIPTGSSPCGRGDNALAALWQGGGLPANVASGNEYRGVVLALWLAADRRDFETPL